MRMLAIALVVLGAVALLAGGLGYDRQRTVLEVGGLKATATEHKTIPYSPIVGGVALLAGIVMLVGVKQPARS